jgi:acyl-CoA hydrolase
VKERPLNITHTHRLILPADANHHGTLYAGSLLRIALEAAYATAHRHVGSQANLVLRRVISIECYYPAPVGHVIEIGGVALHQTQAYLVVGLIGTPIGNRTDPWMDGLLGFVQIDEHGKPARFPPGTNEINLPTEPHWQRLLERVSDR